MHCFGDKIISIFDLRYILLSYSIISLDTQKTIMKANSPQMDASDTLEILSGSTDTKLNN